MEVLCIEGAVPGPIRATVAHQGAIRHLAVQVLRHPAGGWQVRQADGGLGLRCHAVPTALLLEAAEIFAEGGDVAETAREAA